MRSKKKLNTCLEFGIPFAIDRTVEYPALLPAIIYSVMTPEGSAVIFSMLQPRREREKKEEKKRHDLV
jgi:hypothetical protein